MGVCVDSVHQELLPTQHKSWCQAGALAFLPQPEVPGWELGF